MRIFLDTSVLVAGCVSRHPHFARANPILERLSAGMDEGYISVHSLAECCSTFTNLPLTPRITPVEARLIIQRNVRAHVSLVTLDEENYSRALEACERLGLSGGAVYDALLLECARQIEIDRIYTFKTRDFQRLAPDLAGRIAAP